MATLQVERQTDSSLIAVDRFIQATRDSGYKSTGSAISELIDNSIEAGARHVAIHLGTGVDGSPTVEVVDDGSGMDASTLCEALRFGGTTRFGSRSGLGRYGMGLPNSSVSQARRLEVVTWQRQSNVLGSYLDIDEIIAGKLATVPLPRPFALPEIARQHGFAKGTLVRWLNCDRLDYRRSSTLIEKLQHHLGRVFRHFLWKGLDLTINGVKVRPLDPLLVSKRSSVSGASIFGSPLEFDLSIPLPGKQDADVSGKVTVIFSLLPVSEWHSLSNDEKREQGITKGAGMSIIRGGREVDYGWWFFGDKRKENYDDWWCCELQFDPALDEVFGITHTKQQIRPIADLVAALAPDIETTAKALNRHVRQAHEALKFSSAAKPAETVAAAREKLLPELTVKALPSSKTQFQKMAKRHPSLLGGSGGDPKHPQYSLIVESLKEPRIFQTLRDSNRVAVILNTEHAFYKRIYLPLSEASEPSTQRFKQQVDLFLLAAARAECMTKQGANEFLGIWSDVLNTFLS